MTSASPTTEQDTDQHAEAAPEPTCQACPHPWDGHDAIGRRFCSASIASGRTTSGCVCKP